MSHQTEHEHAFIKDNRVVNIAVFAEHDAELIEKVREQYTADQSICCCDLGSIPTIHSSWDGTSFEYPTQEYLFSIGVIAECLPPFPPAE